MVNGQSLAHVENLVGFAGRALLWSSAAALLSVQPKLNAAELTFGQHEAVVTQANQSAQFFKSRNALFAAVIGTPPNKFFVSAPQVDANITAPVTFLPMMQVAHGRGTFGSVYPDAELLEWNPSFFNRTFRPAAAPTSPINARVSAAALESGEQVQPVFHGQTPLPSPAAGPIKVAWPFDAEAISRASEYTIFWGGKATLPIAAVQFYLPPGKEFSASPQESTEQIQPVFAGQQPLPSAAVGLSKISAPTDVEAVTQASQYATFWQGHAALFIAATQFTVPPSHALVVSEQPNLDQPQPQLWGHNEDVFLAAFSVPLRNALVVPQQESGEQPQPVFIGQQPLPSPAVGLSKVAAPSDVEAVARASELAAFWDGKATLQIAAVQFDLPPSRRVSAVPQESGEQYQPVIFGQQPLPSPALGPIRIAGPIDAEQTAVQYGTVWVGDATLYVAVTQDVPRKPATIVAGQESADQIQPQVWGRNEDVFLAAFSVPLRPALVVPEQQSGEQQQPIFSGQTPLPSPVVGLSKVAAPSDVESLARSNEFATFWIGHASLFIAQSQFTVPPRDAVIVDEQRQLDQPQPQIWGRAEDVFLDATTVPPSKRISAAPQESGEQQPAAFKGQTPLPSPGLTQLRTAAPLDVQEVSRQSEAATFWEGHAALFVAATQFDVRVARWITAQPQESGEQLPAQFSGQQPLPAPAFRAFAAQGQDNLEQPAALIFRPQFSLYAVAEQSFKRLLFAAPEENLNQAQPYFYSQYRTPEAATQAPPFRQFFVPEQYDVQQPKPLLVNLPLPESQVTPPPPTAGSGGDRGVNLFREVPKPPKQARVPAANFRVAFFESGDRFKARFGVQSDFDVSSVLRDSTFYASLDVASNLSYRSIDAATFGVKVLVTGKVERAIPVKPNFAPARLRVTFETGNDEMKVKFKVES